MTATLARPQAWLTRNDTHGLGWLLPARAEIGSVPADTVPVRDRSAIDFTRRSSAPMFRVTPLPSCQV